MNQLGTLVVKSTDGAERIVRLSEGQSLTIGRDTTNDISINEPGVSRLHATITVTANGAVIADNASTNGTFVNGEKLSSLHDIQDNDLIDIGGSKLIVKLESAKAVNSLSNHTATRAMTAQLTPLSVTVLVASVSNYFEMQKNIPAQDLNRMFDLWLASIKKIILAYNGVIDKIIGHRVVIVWKSKEAKKFANQAMQAAIKMRILGQSQTLKSAWNYEDTFPWNNTVVIGSGGGLEGVLGTGGKNNFTLLGDPINLSFKLEELVSKLGQDLIIEESTAELVKEDFKLEKVIKVKIKGSDRQIDIFTLPN